MSNVIVIGGGAAGMMAAIGAAMAGHKVSLYEKNEKLGKKIYITGKGRCNVTNACETEELFQKIVTNSKFMYSAIYTYDNNMVQTFFEENGCPLKVERGNRVFPVSDKSYDVINALEYKMKDLGVDIYLNRTVSDIIVVDKQVKGIIVGDKKIMSDSVIIATGGYSYPTTGSTGEGHTMAKKAGHKITKCVPALVPFNTKEEWVKELQGLSLRNVNVNILGVSSDISVTTALKLFLQISSLPPPQILDNWSPFWASKAYNKYSLLLPTGTKYTFLFSSRKAPS